MQFESIERELHIAATPETVYEVISSPEHVQQWWPDEAQFDATPGATGFVAWGDRSTPGAKVVPLTVVEADPPRRFSFRWAQEDGEPAASGNSNLVTFDLTPSAGGTLLRFTESGFREKGLDDEALAQQYADHARGWDGFLPRLAAYAPGLVSTS